jgi:hypothetical protein
VLGNNYAYRSIFPNSNGAISSTMPTEDNCHIAHRVRLVRRDVRLLYPIGQVVSYGLVGMYTAGLTALSFRQVANPPPRPPPMIACGPPAR